MHVHVLYITLGGSRETACRQRLDQLEAHFGDTLTTERSVGVDGNRLNKQVLMRQGRYKPLSPQNSLTTGQLGCFLAHRAAWERARELSISHPTTATVIIEDDAVLTPACVREMKRVLSAARTTSTWCLDLLLLGADPRLCTRTPESTSETRPTPPSTVAIGRTWGLFAYWLSAAALHRLHESAVATRPMRVAVDLFLTTHYRLTHRYLLTHHPATRVPTAVSLSEQDTDVAAEPHATTPQQQQLHTAKTIQKEPN